MKHALLVEAGHWLARGEFITAAAEARPVGDTILSLFQSQDGAGASFVGGRCS